MLQAKQVIRTRTMAIEAPPENVFPMLCPVREHDYLEHWQATVVHSESGLAEKGCVFETPGPETWYISEHNQQTGRIVFVIFASSRLSRLDVDLQPEGNGSKLTFTYTHTALDRQGDAFVEGFTEQLFREKMDRFEDSLNQYLNSQTL